MTGRDAEPLDVRKIFASEMSERQLDETVRDLCKWLGVKCFSVRNSSAGIVTCRGYPDLTLCGANGVIWRELKTETGKLSREQVEWGEWLTAAGASWAVWRPGQLIDQSIRRELEQLAGRQTCPPGMAGRD